MPGPFGARPLVYADYTASGRSLAFLEAAIAERVLPYYANTHTETSYTGRQSTRLREGAREAVRRGAGADERHAVIFAGSGATGAVDRLVQVLGLKAPEGLRAAVPERDRPVVFVGPYEHHSNELPWRESLARVVRIPLGADGRPCLSALEEALAAHADRPLKVGAFSAASNVTGIRTDLDAIARAMHAHGGIVVCDYAAGGPYMPIRMTESAPGAGDYKDAVVISPHKFVGGPGTPGILVAGRALFANSVPAVSGGGTVSYVTADSHCYVGDPERREEAGTPGIVESIRAGLVFQLKQDVGTEAIAEREALFVRRALEAWGGEPAIALLGPEDADRLAIFSFNIRVGGKCLHHNFVVALLNDLFGIQARGGCSCAGPYAHDLLGLTCEDARRHEALVGRGLGLFRPGWARLGFNFFLDEAEADYIVRSVLFVARHGARFLASYRPDPATGVWTHSAGKPPATLEFADLCAAWRGGAEVAAGRERAPDYETCLAAAHDAAHMTGPAPERVVLDEEAEAARWFWMPHEAGEIMAGVGDGAR